MKILRQLPFITALYLGAALLAGCVGQIPNTGPELKAWLEQPGVLLLVMFLGAFGSALKTVSTAQRDGSLVTLPAYLSKWPETMTAIIGVLIAWGSLLLADQLNFAAAAAFGAVANTSADTIRSGGRTTVLAAQRSPHFVGLIACMLAIASLTGCGGNPLREAQTPDAKAAVVLYEFTKIQKIAKAIGSDNSVPANVRRKMLDAVIEAKPGVDDLDKALRAYQAAVLEVAAGASSDEKIIIALRTLNSLLPAVQSDVANLQKDATP